MRYLIIVIAMLTSCQVSEIKYDVKPFTKLEIISLRDSFGIKSNVQFRKYDMTDLSPVEFLRYLSSVNAFEELGELKSKSTWVGVGDRVLYIPYMLPSKIKKGWIDENERSELLKLIGSKQPSTSTMNRYAASFPDQLSTVGIEAMHLINYSMGKDAAYVSNREFCPNEKQDSFVYKFQKSYLW